MNVRLVEKFVGFDGQTYFCRLCGRAGFKSVASVRGHLGYCPSRKGGLLSPLKVAGSALEVAGGAGAGAPLRGQEHNIGASLSSLRGALRGQEYSIGASLSSVQAGRVPDGMDERYWAMMQDVTQRLDRMEQTLYNELPHQVAVVQAQQQSFDNKWLKWVIVGYIAIWFLRKLGDDSIVKKAGSKIDDRVLGKAIDGLLDL